MLREVARHALERLDSRDVVTRNHVVRTRALSEFVLLGACHRIVERIHAVHRLVIADFNRHVLGERDHPRVVADLGDEASEPRLHRREQLHEVSALLGAVRSIEPARDRGPSRGGLHKLILVHATRERVPTEQRLDKTRVLRNLGGWRDNAKLAGLEEQDLVHSERDLLRVRLRDSVKLGRVRLYHRLAVALKVEDVREVTGSRRERDTDRTERLVHRRHTPTGHRVFSRDRERGDLSERM